MLPVASAPPQAEAVTLLVPTDPEQLQLLAKVPEFVEFWFAAMPLHALKFQVDAARAEPPKVIKAALATSLPAWIQQFLFMARSFRCRVVVCVTPKRLRGLQVT